MLPQPLISICIPTLNRCLFLKECLHAFIKQICKEGLEDVYEICISDNCSNNDGTWTYLSSLMKKYTFINARRNEANLGPSINILLAARMARGEFIWFFSDDDLVIEGGLKEIAGIIKNIKNIDRDIHAIYVNWNYFKGSGEAKEIMWELGKGLKVNVPAITSNRNNLLRITKDKLTFMSSNIVRKDLFFRNSSIWPYCRSWFPHFEKTLALLDDNEKVLILTKPFVLARANNESYDGIEAVLKGIAQMLDELQLTGINRKIALSVKKGIAWHYLRAVPLLKIQDKEKALDVVRIINIFYRDCLLQRLGACALYYLFPSLLYIPIRALFRKTRKLIKALKRGKRVPI